MKVVALRCRPAGGDFKPPHAALAKDFVNMSGGGAWCLASGAVWVDGGEFFWTSGVALREEASNHLPGPWLKTVVLNGVGKGAAVIVSGVDRKDQRWVERPSAD